MKYFSMFSGIGGFELGIQQAYETTEQKPECVGYSEIERYAIHIYTRHFPNHKNYGDATTINPSELPEFDLLVGGFPCQAFSIAGKRGGFEDTRGTLFFEIARILRAKRPKYFLVENVKGLLSHNKGNTFATIISAIDELGYDCQWDIVNSKDYGVPQNRERVFIIGHLRGERRPKVFPIGEGGQVNDKIQQEQRGEESRSSCLNTRYGQRWTDETYIRTIFDETRGNAQAQRIRSIDGVASTLQGLAGGQGAKTGLYSVKTQIRRLTPTECERLQGFPDGWTKDISDTQRYKVLGNAVTVNVIQFLIEKMFQE